MDNVLELADPDSGANRSQFTMIDLSPADLPTECRHAAVAAPANPPLSALLSATTKEAEVRTLRYRRRASPRKHPNHAKK